MVSFISDSEFSQLHQNCKCRYRLKTIRAFTPSKNDDPLKNLLLDRVDTLFLNNDIIQLHHTLLCAAIHRESNQTNENKSLRVLNQAYATLMSQSSNLKPLGAEKYVHQLHSRIFCVEHTGSFCIYTLEGFTDIFQEEIKKLPVFLNGKQRPVNGNTGFMITSVNYDVHITIYSSGTIHIQGVKALFIGNLIKSVIVKQIIPKLDPTTDPNRHSKHYAKCAALFSGIPAASSPLPNSLQDIEMLSNCSFSMETNNDITPENVTTPSSCPVCPKLTDKVNKLAHQIEILTARVSVLETRRPGTRDDSGLEAIKADIQNVDDHFTACLAKTDSVVASLVEEIEHLMPSPREENHSSFSPALIRPSRSHRDENSPPPERPNPDTPVITNRHQSAQLSQQPQLTSNERHSSQTTPSSGTQTNNNTSSTSQQDSETQTSLTISNSDPRSPPPNQSQNSNSNNNRWNNTSSQLKQAPQGSLRRTSNNTEHTQTNRDADRMRTVLIDNIDIEHYRTLKTDGDIRKAVFINHRSVVIDTITRVGRNKPKLLIKLKDANMAYELVQKWKDTTFTKSRAQINQQSTNNNNIIGIARGIPLEASDEEINEDLMKLYEGAKASRLTSHSGPMRAVKIVFKTRQDLENAIIFSVWLEGIGVNCAVEESKALNIIQCYNCWCLGHTSKICANSKTCCNCGSSSCEDMERCRTQPKCSNCSGNHKANNRDCPKYQQVKANLLKRHG